MAVTMQRPFVMLLILACATRTASGDSMAKLGDDLSGDVTLGKGQVQIESAGKDQASLVKVVMKGHKPELGLVDQHDLQCPHLSDSWWPVWRTCRNYGGARRPCLAVTMLAGVLLSMVILGAVRISMSYAAAGHPPQNVFHGRDSAEDVFQFSHIRVIEVDASEKQLRANLAKVKTQQAFHETCAWWLAAWNLTIPVSSIIWLIFLVVDPSVEQEKGTSGT
eukprot:TRINITY_DN101592_c0_g1_i1.p1 TRINITY_DN101592_c0_g1~~TRINITY_DN101592_c0_g1_i1.p1  ORF type:complete len:233 (-),score=20.56 TRINITY_DN101592_c0_g1_i1:626-1288(-)